MKYDELLTKSFLEENYLKHKSLRKIADELGIDRNTIKVYMIKNNVKYDPELRISGGSRQRLYNCDDDFFSRDNELSFYWAGFMAADGCIDKRSINLQLVLAIKDIEHLYKFNNSVKSNYKIREFIQNGKYGACGLTINSRKICQDLERFNIVNNKSKTYSIPGWMKKHPLRHHFIRGYNDGDGCFLWVKTKTPKLRISMVGTDSCLTTIREIIENDLGLDKKTKPIRINKGIGILEYNGNCQLRKIVEYLYFNASTYLTRKKDIAFEIFNIKEVYNLDNIKSFKKNSKDDLAKSFNKLKSFNAMSKKYGVSGHTIKMYLKKHEII